MAVAIAFNFSKMVFILAPLPSAGCDGDPPIDDIDLLK